MEHVNEVLGRSKLDLLYEDLNLALALFLQYVSKENKYISSFQNEYMCCCNNHRTKYLEVFFPFQIQAVNWNPVESLVVWKIISYVLTAKPLWCGLILSNIEAAVLLRAYQKQHIWIKNAKAACWIAITWDGELKNQEQPSSTTAILAHDHPTASDKYIWLHECCEYITVFTV